MIRSTRVMRITILSRLWEHLKDEYSLEFPRSTFVSGRNSDGEIDAILAFKSDPRLDELRGALSRLKNGTYGTCIRCKRQISQAALDSDPAQRLCPDCERELSFQYAENRSGVNIPQ
jgi:RNA polymerase-binding transcription factor DksA